MSYLQTNLLTTIILSAAKNIGVPGSLLLAICTHETGLKHKIAYNDGKTHTFGMCQVKHETAKMLGFKGTEKDLMNPKTNAKYAAKYLKYQLKRYDNDWCKSTSAYNAGSFLIDIKNPNRPKNIVYLNKVSLFLNNVDKIFLECKTRKVASK